MADADEDAIRAPENASTQPEVDLSDETQDFRFLNHLNLYEQNYSGMANKTSIVLDNFFHYLLLKFNFSTASPIHPLVFRAVERKTSSPIRQNFKPMYSPLREGPCTMRSHTPVSTQPKPAS
jgi:hypothetical protein